MPPLALAPPEPGTRGSSGRAPTLGGSGRPGTSAAEAGPLGPRPASHRLGCSSQPPPCLQRTVALPSHCRRIAVTLPSRCRHITLSPKAARRRSCLLTRDACFSQAGEPAAHRRRPRQARGLRAVARGRKGHLGRRDREGPVHRRHALLHGARGHSGPRARLRGMVKVPQRARLGSMVPQLQLAPARPLCLLSARLAALGGSALPG